MASAVVINRYLSFLQQDFKDVTRHLESFQTIYLYVCSLIHYLSDIVL